MKTSPTFWLTFIMNILTVCIAVSLVFFMSIPKEGRREHRYLGAYLFLWFANESSSMIGYHLLHFRMNMSINIVNFFFLPLMVMMYESLRPIKNATAIAYTIIGAFWSFAIVNIFFIQGPFHMNTYTWILANMIIVTLSLYYFYFLIKQVPLQTSLRNIPMFWINLAVLIFYSGTIFVYFFEDYLVKALSSNLIIPFYFHVSFALIFQPIAWYALRMIRSDYRNSESPS